MRKHFAAAITVVALCALVVTPVLAQDVPDVPVPDAPSTTFLPLITQPLDTGAAAKPPAQQPAPTGKGGGANADKAGGPGVDAEYALVQLQGEPLTIAAQTRPPQGKKVDFDSNTVKNYRAQLAARRNEFKRWLRQNAPKAQVTGEFDIALNAVSVKLNGTALETIQRAPMVVAAEYQGLYYKTLDPVVNPDANDPDLSLIGDVTNWPGDGEGIKVGIIDSGIDQTHPCFDDEGYSLPEGWQTTRGQTEYTNNKVIVAKVFNNKVNQNGLDAEAVNSHGTHVAGTVACNALTEATVEGVDIPYDVSGVASRAWLGNYNVFPGEVDNARSEDILNALDAAYSDGMDVVNMSLSGGYHGVQDLLTHAVDNFVRANMVVAMANSNDGPGYGTAGSPGVATLGLAAGASSVPHFVGTPVTVDGGASLPDITVGAAAGDFNVVTETVTSTLTAVLSGTVLSQACNASPAIPAGSLEGKIALIGRGTCTFSEKILNAQNAGAIVVLVANNVAGDPVAMALGGLPTEPTVPAYMVSRDSVPDLLARNGQQATISPDLQYFETPNANIMAGFSSWGPSRVDFRIKPDLVAPGVNVLSSIPMSYCEPEEGEEPEPNPCFAFFQGTSMASPHVAGAAAVVRGEHPGWSALEVNSAIVNTADREVLLSYVDASPTQDVNIIGSGLLSVTAAANAAVALYPTNVSFGSAPAGGGQSRSVVITLTTLDGGSDAYDAEIVGDAADDGVTFEAEVSGNTVTVTVQFDKGAAFGHKQAWLVISRGGEEVAHAAIYTFVK